MSKTTGVDIQESIERMVRDVVRVPCSKVLLSPDMHAACLDRIVERLSGLFDGLHGTTLTDEVFIRGVPAEKCDALSSTEYALVPKLPENQITINGVPVEFIQPFKPFVPDEQRPFHHFDTQKLLAALGYCRCDVGVSDVAEFVAGQMLNPDVRKRVLEARVFEE